MEVDESNIETEDNLKEFVCKSNVEKPTIENNDDDDDEIEFIEEVIKTPRIPFQMVKIKEEKNVEEMDIFDTEAQEQLKMKIKKEILADFKICRLCKGTVLENEEAWNFHLENQHGVSPEEYEDLML